MPNRFLQKIAQTDKHTILYLNPKFELLPLPITRYDDPFLPFSKAIIAATSDIVAGYMFDFAAYLAMAGAGAVALERSIAYVPDTCVTILHGAFTGIGYSPMAATTGFNIDAMTVSTERDLKYYTEHIPHMAFLLTTGDSTVLETGGLFRQEQRRIAFKHKNVVRSLSITTDNILYSSKLDDFAEKVREGVLSLDDC